MEPTTEKNESLASKAQSNPDHDPTTKELLREMIALFGRDQELRQGFLEAKQSEVKHNKYKTRAMIVFFGLPLIMYALVLADVIKAQWISGDYVAMVSIEGVIHSDKPASAARIIPGLKKAFEDKNAKGVIIRINSPGGSPVQSDIIYKAISDYRKQYPNTKVATVIEDFGASGGYWIASSADEIYANEASVVGSIGVIYEDMGLVLDKFFSKYGVERRVITAGESKSRNDMFTELKPEDIAKTKESLASIHEQFKARVLATRKNKLKAPLEKIFTGDYWTGQKALELGLIDGIGSVGTIAKEKMGAELVADYSPAVSIFDRMGKFKSETASSLYLDLIAVITGKNFLAL